MMSFCTRFVVTSCAVLLVAVEAHPDDTQQITRRLAALENLRNSVASNSYALSDEDVRELVLESLRRNESQPPKEMPPAQELRRDLDVGFEATWNEMIRKATDGLDPKVQLTLIDELKALVKDKPVRLDAESRHKNFVSQDLPAALERVTKQIVEKQTEELLTVLTDVIKAGVLTEELVAEASRSDTSASVTRLTDAVLERVTETFSETLLVDSVSTLSLKEEEIMTDSVSQLDEQRETLTTLPEAVSQPAIQKELEGRLQSIADKQRSARTDSPLRPVYGIFSEVQQAVPGEARQWFDQRVAKTSEDIWQDVANRKRRPPSQDADRLRKMILDNAQSHHSGTDSLQIAQPYIQDMTRGAAQRWITDQLVSALKRSTSLEDGNYDTATFRREVVQILDQEDSLGHAAWEKFQAGLKRIYEQQIFPAVREKIANEQAAEFAPVLLENQWRPTETDLQNNAIPLTPAALAELEVWRDRAPLRTEVLDETWKIWLRQAENALRVCKEAQFEQQRVVSSLETEMTELIRVESKRTQDAWVELYCDKTRNKWASVPTVAARNHPRLFESTVEQIRGIVAKLIESVEAESAADPAPKEGTPEQQDSVVSDGAVPTQPEQQPSDTAPPPSVPQDALPADDPAGPDNAAEGNEAQTPAGMPGVEDAGQGQIGGNSSAETADEVPAGESGESQAGDEQSQDATAEAPPIEESDVLQMGVPLTADRRGLSFYQIGFWVLLCLLLLISACWYWNVRVLRQELALLRRSRLLDTAL